MLDDSEGRLWRLRWPHHKNEQRYSQQAVSAACAANCMQTCRLCCKPADCAANCLQTASCRAFSHNSIVCRWGKREIHFKLPKEAEPVLSRYLECRNLLAQADNPCLLVTPTGLVYDLSNYNQRFWEILCTWQAPARFSPQVRQST